MGASGMAIDQNGKPIKRQSNNNNNKGGQKNNKKGGQKGGQQKNNRGGSNAGRGGNVGRGGGGGFRGGPPPMHMVPPFHPMGGPMGPIGPMNGPPMGPMGGPGPMRMGGPNPNFGFFNNRGGPKNHDNRNGGQQSGYNGPSANTVGQGSIGGEVPVDVPGFGKNSNIHELFGKMVWRKMEQIRDPGVVDNLQNRIMNMIHDSIAAQGDQRPPNGNGLSNKAFNNF